VISFLLHCYWGRLFFAGFLLPPLTVPTSLASNCPRGFFYYPPGGAVLLRRPSWSDQVKNRSPSFRSDLSPPGPSPSPKFGPLCWWWQFRHLFSFDQVAQPAFFSNAGCTFSFPPWTPFIFWVHFSFFALDGGAIRFCGLSTLHPPKGS